MHDIGTRIDFSKTNFKAARGAAPIVKSDVDYTYDYIFRYIKGRFYSARITPGCVPVFVA